MPVLLNTVVARDEMVEAAEIAEWECKACKGSVRYSPSTGLYFHKTGDAHTESIAREVKPKEI